MVTMKGAKSKLQGEDKEKGKRISPEVDQQLLDKIERAVLMVSLCIVQTLPSYCELTIRPQ